MLLVDGVHEFVINVNTERLGMGHHLHEDTGTLQDGLVVGNVSETVDEVFDLKFLVELAFKDGGFLEHLDVDIDLVLLDLTESVGHNGELVLVDSVL